MIFDRYWACTCNHVSSKEKNLSKIYSGDEVPPESGPDRAKSYLYMASIDGSPSLCWSQFSLETQALQPPRMAQQSVLLAPQVSSVEEGLARWNDAMHPLDLDDPRHQQPPTAADTLKADNAQQVNVNKTNHPSTLESTLNAPSPISGSPSASIRDSASTHSLPVVRITEPQRSPALPQGPDLPSQSDDDGTNPVQRSVVSGASAPPPSGRGNMRSRPAIDVR